MNPQKIKILHLSLKTKWYRMIEAGEKPKEYRELTPYFMVRLFEMNDDEVTGNYVPMSKKTTQDIVNHPECSEMLNEAIECYDIRARYTHVQFSIGYPKNGDESRRMTFELKAIEYREGREEWGAEKGKKYLVMVLGGRTTLDGTKISEVNDDKTEGNQSGLMRMKKDYNLALRKRHTAESSTTRPPRY